MMYFSLNEQTLQFKECSLYELSELTTTILVFAKQPSSFFKGIDERLMTIILSDNNVERLESQTTKSVECHIQESVECSESPRPKTNQLQKLWSVVTRYTHDICLSSYFSFLLLRILGITLYFAYATTCFLNESNSTFQCRNSTVFPHPKETEISWQFSSIVSAFICVSFLQQVDGFQGYKRTILRLFKLSRFWSLLFQLIIAVTYNVILIFHENSFQTMMIAVGYICEEISAIVVIFFWDFVPKPRDPKRPGLAVAYDATLVVYFFEKFAIFLVMSAHAAFDITGVLEFHSRSAPMKAIILLLNAAEVTFYFALIKFFWLKMFNDKWSMLEYNQI